jgi:DNA-binding GntR family transcriptional regulator
MPVSEILNKSENLAERTYRQIEELLVTLQLQPGMIVSEGDLASRFGVSRTPVREALQRLARGGLIRVMPKRGLLVTEIDIQKQLRMLELRREVERLIARRAARLASPEERQELCRIAKDMAAAGRADDQDAFTSVDRRLNRLVAECGRNEFATEAMEQVQGLSRRFWYCHQQRFADVATSSALHQALAVEIAGGDEGAAGRASDTLLDYVESFTRAVLDKS